MVKAEYLGWGIHVLDTAYQREHMAACYVMEQDGEVAIIETGTKDTVPLIFAFLEQHNLPSSAIKYVMPTHVHLDHAGGAGLLMQALPHAQLVVHPQGARHMIDPSKLQAGATAVYGEAMFQSVYGDLLPIDPAQVMSVEDGQTLKLGSRTLTFLDTPGHARHHYCVFDDVSEGFFTGDTFGLAYQELTTHNGPFIFPTTTPVQFDPEALKASIKRLLSYEPKRMFLTHYSMVENPQELGKRLLYLVDEFVRIALEVQEQVPVDQWLNELNGRLLRYLMNDLSQHETTLSSAEYAQVIASDVLLNAQGIEVWLHKNQAA
ncbi:MAG: MBL fold metallo-hydrolase [Gammaproteobacteria bacterium]|nr:MBL fold metallo-hydrolase [Gammaproteobacteria bacterium]